MLKSIYLSHNVVICMTTHNSLTRAFYLSFQQLNYVEIHLFKSHCCNVDRTFFSLSHIVVLDKRFCSFLHFCLSDLITYLDFLTLQVLKFGHPLGEQINLELHAFCFVGNASFKVLNISKSITKLFPRGPLGQNLLKTHSF